MTVFSDSLRRRMSEMGIAHAEVAKKAGLSEQRYGNYVSGRRSPDLQTASRIAAALNTTVDDLLAADRPQLDGNARAAMLQRLMVIAEKLSDHDLAVCLLQAEAVLKAFPR